MVRGGWLALLGGIILMVGAPVPWVEFGDFTCSSGYWPFQIGSMIVGLLIVALVILGKEKKSTIGLMALSAFAVMALIWNFVSMIVKGASFGAGIFIAAAGVGMVILGTSMKSSFPFTEMNSGRRWVLLGAIFLLMNTAVNWLIVLALAFTQPENGVIGLNNLLWPVIYSVIRALPGVAFLIVAIRVKGDPGRYYSLVSSLIAILIIIGKFCLDTVNVSLLAVFASKNLNAQFWSLHCGLIGNYATYLGWGAVFIGGLKKVPVVAPMAS